MELFPEAFTACLGAGEIFQDTGDWHGAGEALSNLGIALREMGRFEEAITACQYAALFFRETHDEYNEGIALANLEEAQQATRQA
jgi:tetratricopeptide (TPR) repeat protein